MDSSLLHFEIQYFIQIAQSESFLAAAEKLGLSQPTLSRAMDRLESRLGFKTLKRSRNGISLTKEGTELFFRIKGLRDNLELMVKGIRGESDVLSGEIKIGGHRTVLKDFLLPHAAAMAEEFPFLRFHLTAKPSGEIVQLIRDKQLDIGFAINPAPYNQLLIRPVGSTQGLFFSEIPRPTRFYVNPQMIEMGRMLRLLKKKLLNESNVQFVDDYELIGDLVANRMGCGLLPDHVGYRLGLRVEQELSATLKAHYQLRLIANSEALDEKARKALRFLEQRLKTFPTR